MSRTTYLSGVEAEIMMVDLRGRFLVLVLLAELACLPGSPGSVQEKTPFPQYTGDRVYTVDVPGSFDSLKETIKQLERSSPQSYFVVARGMGTSTDGAIPESSSRRLSRPERA